MTRRRFWWCRTCDVKWSSYDCTCWVCGRDASIKDAIPSVADEEDVA